jgi:hypothetical protein
MLKMAQVIAEQAGNPLSISEMLLAIAEPQSHITRPHYSNLSAWADSNHLNPGKISGLLT